MVKLDVLVMDDVFAFLDKLCIDDTVVIQPVLDYLTSLPVLVDNLPAPSPSVLVMPVLTTIADQSIRIVCTTIIRCCPTINKIEFKRVDVFYKYCPNKGEALLVINVLPKPLTPYIDISNHLKLLH